MVISTNTKERILGILSTIPDPEIPVINIVEMGMVRDVTIDVKAYEVWLTPSYSGCPAMGIIEDDIKKKLIENGIFPVNVKLVYDPAWTTDWITGKTKEKLLHYGIAPPLHSSCTKENFTANEISCPQCGSKNTVMLSRFGATACKALYQCNDCKEPFEYFKCH